MKWKKQGPLPGEIIRKRRKELGISIEAVAVSLGVSTKFVSLCEHGRRKLPVKHLATICQFLEIPLDELIEAKFREEFSRMKKKGGTCGKVESA